MSTEERPEQQPPSPLDMLRDQRAIVDTGLGPGRVRHRQRDLRASNTAAAVAVGISVVVAVWSSG